MEKLTVFPYERFLSLYSNKQFGNEALGLCGWTPESVLLVDRHDPIVQSILTYLKGSDVDWVRVGNTGIFLFRSEPDVMVLKLSL